MSLMRLSFAGLLAGTVLSGLSAAPAYAAARHHTHEPAPASEAPPTSPDMVRPSVGKALEAAEAYARARKFPEAMAQIDIADHARDKTAHENFVIAEMRASVAQQAGDYKAAIAADEELLRSKMPAAEQQKLLMAEASSAYQLRDYAQSINAIGRYFKAGGNASVMQQLLIQCYYLQKDYAHAAAEQSAQIEAGLRAGQTPPEAQLQLLANCQLQVNDQAGLTRTMVRLVTYYPKPDYWAQLLHGLRANPNVPDRLQYDIDRIRLEVGLLTATADFMDMTEMAVQDGLPEQALAVMDKGYASGALGRDPQAAREARLKALVERTIADRKASIAADEASARSTKNSNALFAAGYSYVDLGQAQKGIAVMREAMAMGGLLAPDDAMLHLGLAYMQAGDKADAIRTLQSVGGTDGAADLAHLWQLRIGKA
jgi:tetratricopeptide (TPR) repeat protein